MLLLETLGENLFLTSKLLVASEASDSLWLVAVSLQLIVPLFCLKRLSTFLLHLGVELDNVEYSIPHKIFNYLNILFLLHILIFTLCYIR